MSSHQEDTAILSVCMQQTTELPNTWCENDANEEIGKKSQLLSKTSTSLNQQLIGYLNRNPQIFRISQLYHHPTRLY